MFSPRIHLKPLAQLCHRLATATSAGIEDRKIWRDESQRGSAAQQRRIAAIRDAVAAGHSVSEGLRKTGDYFPPLFRTMVEVGEISGGLDRTYKRLAQHYDKTLAAKRAFTSRIAWPVMQLVIAIFIVGLLIWIMGVLARGPHGATNDMLGFGLTGTRGLVIYINIVLAAAIGLIVVSEAIRRGALWTRGLQRFVTALPMIGDALQTLALARFTWALQLVLDTSMDLRKALPLALDASGNDYFARHGPTVAQYIQQGHDMATSLALTDAFPVEFLDSVRVGEESGRMVETMERMSTEYQERAGLAISVLAQLAGYAVWAIVAGLIIFMIFRIFSSYLGAINSLL